MLHRFGRALQVESHPGENRLNLRFRLGRGHAVELGAVEQVLPGRELLEETRLDANSIHHPLRGPWVVDSIDAEDARLALVREDQGREDADQRALPAPVRTEDTDDLAATDLQRDPVEGVDVLAALLGEPLLDVDQLQCVAIVLTHDRLLSHDPTTRPSDACENGHKKRLPVVAAPGASLLSNRVRRWFIPSTRRWVEQGGLLPEHTGAKRLTERSTGADAIGHPDAGHVTPLLQRAHPAGPGKQNGGRDGDRPGRRLRSIYWASNPMPTRANRVRSRRSLRSPRVETCVVLL